MFSPAVALRIFGSRTSQIAIARMIDTASVFQCLTPFESDEEKRNTPCPASPTAHHRDLRNWNRSSVVKKKCRCRVGQERGIREQEDETSQTPEPAHARMVGLQ
jgi:hypothetical protein